MLSVKKTKNTKAVGLTTRDALRLDEKDALEQINERMARQGLSLLVRPVGESGRPLEPGLPTDLTRLNDVQLGRLYGEFCVMAQYAYHRLAVHSVERSVYRAREKYMRAQARLSKDGTVSDKNDQVETDLLVRKRAIAALTSEGIETLTKAMLDGYVIGRDACSRELTRRQMTMADPNLRR